MSMRKACRISKITGAAKEADTSPFSGSIVPIVAARHRRSPAR